MDFLPIFVATKDRKIVVVGQGKWLMPSAAVFLRPPLT